MTNASLESEFCTYAATKLRDNLKTIEKCLALLTVEQVWSRPNPVSNSIGNLVLHLRGNVQQWIVALIAGREFQRNRPEEFAERGPMPTEQIRSPLQQTVADAAGVIERLTAARLVERGTVQGYDVTVLSAVTRTWFDTGSTANVVPGVLRLLVSEALVAASSAPLRAT